MKQKVGSLKKNKQDRQTSGKLNKMRREKTQISKMKNTKAKIKTNTMEVQEIIRDCFESI
jgi:hypothetical protein